MERNCRQCSKIFTPHHPLEKICSDLCRKQRQQKVKEVWRRNNTDRNTVYQKTYRNKNKQVYNSLMRDYAKKNPKVVQRISKNNSTRQKENMSKCYIANLIRIPVTSLTDNLYYAKRNQLLLKRQVLQETGIPALNIKRLNYENKKSKGVSDGNRGPHQGRVF